LAVPVGVEATEDERESERLREGDPEERRVRDERDEGRVRGRCRDAVEEVLDVERDIRRDSVWREGILVEICPEEAVRLDLVPDVELAADPDLGLASSAMSIISAQLSSIRSTACLTLRSSIREIASRRVAVTASLA